MTKKVSPKMSPELGKKISEFLKLKKKISAKNKEVEDLKSAASELEKAIILAFETDTKTIRADVSTGSVTLKSKPVFSVGDGDWPKIWTYIFKHKNSNLLEKRLSQSAISELMEDGVKIPGISRMTRKYLSVGHKRGN